jgi:hypothetical protein
MHESMVFLKFVNQFNGERTRCDSCVCSGIQERGCHRMSLRFRNTTVTPGTKGRIPYR